MKIPVLSLTFSPDDVFAAQIWAGLAEDFKKAGRAFVAAFARPAVSGAYLALFEDIAGRGKGAVR